MSSRLVRLLVVLVLAALLVGGCFGAATTPSATRAPSPTESAEESATVRPTPGPTPRHTPSQAGAATPTPRAASARPTPTPTPASGFVLYTVATGDTLSLIATRYNTSWQSLVYWNQDRHPTLDPAQSGYDPNRVEVGWQLVVWPGVVVDYSPPLQTLTPRPATPAPTPSSTAVWNGSRSSPMVALTFDMGGRTDPAVAIMSWLREHDVPATIFVTGSSVDTTTAARQVVSIINARPDLFDLGNHSYSHPDMTGLSAARVTDELRRAQAAIDRYADQDQSPRPLFRPPFGAWDMEVLAGAGSARYAWTVLWDVDTVDWKPTSDGGPTADQIVAKVVTNARGGSIVLMHLGGYQTLDALPEMVAGLHARGYTLVTLNHLLQP